MQVPEQRQQLSVDDPLSNTYLANTRSLLTVGCKLVQQAAHHDCTHMLLTTKDIDSTLDQS